MFSKFGLSDWVDLNITVTQDSDYSGDILVQLYSIADLQIDGAPAPMMHQITVWVQL